MRPDDNHCPGTNRHRRAAHAGTLAPEARADAEPGLPELLAHRTQVAQSARSLLAEPELVPGVVHTLAQADDKPVAVAHQDSRAAVAGKQVETAGGPVGPAVVPEHPPGAAQQQVLPQVGAQARGVPQEPVAQVRKAAERQQPAVPAQLV